MSSDFLEIFTKKPVRESAGSRSSNRFDYQKNWSLCELLKLHTNHSDYLMVFEHHDDIVVFDSQTDPSNAVFYQVKTKTPGNWTIAALTKSKNGIKSILSKLYDNHLIFSDNVKCLVFTSNQPLSAELKSGEKSIELGKVRFSDLSNQNKEKIHSSVEPSELSYCDVAGLRKIVIKKNELSVLDHTAITKGKLVEFFENTHPESETNISLVYKTFFEEIRQKTNYESPISKVADLRQHKSISKSDFEGMIGAVIKRRSDGDLWSEANSLLSSEGFSFMEIRAIRINWQKYMINKMNVSNELHLSLSENINNQINIIDKKNEDGSFKEISEKILNSLMDEHSSDFSKEYMQSAVLYEVLKNDPISKTNTELTE